MAFTPAEPANPLVFKIAEIVFALSRTPAVISPLIAGAYRDFLCAEEPQVSIQISYHGIPHMLLRDQSKVFDSELVWSLYEQDGKKAFALWSPSAGPRPYQLAIFKGDFSQGEIFHRSSKTRMAPKDIASSLGFPLSEVLMVCLLAQERGLMVHACGVDDGGRGYLFAGNSTHGKTTMARLWKGQARILNDDRIVLRQREGRLWMYGTPWHGEYSSVSPHGVPLAKIFFLRHNHANHIHQIAGATAASMLLARCFPPLWDAKGMHFTLDLCASLAETAPCYELGFTPDSSVVDFIRCVQ